MPVHNWQRVYWDDGFRSRWAGHIEGKYCFVHVEVLPGTPLEKQKEENVLWIRGEFLDSKANHRKAVVKGHAIRPEPEALLNRVGIDIGAYSSRILTCLALEEGSQSFLQTQQDTAVVGMAAAYQDLLSVLVSQRGGMCKTYASSKNY